MLDLDRSPSPRASRGLALAVAVLMLALAAPRAYAADGDVPPDGGADAGLDAGSTDGALSDGGPPSDGGPGADAGDGAGDATPPDAAPDAPPDAAPPDAAPPDAALPPTPAVQLDESTPIATLRAQIEALTPAVNGRLPAKVTIASLFTVDLRDTDAVHERVEVLRRSVDAARVALDPLVKRKTEAERGEAGALTAEEAARLERLELLVEREGLRLAVLSRTAIERVALLEAEAARDRAAAEQAAAEQARLAAEAAARSAEAARQKALLESQTARTEAARELAGARAQAESARAAIAEARAAHAQSRKERATAARARGDLIHQARSTLAELDPTPADADSLHRQIVAELRRARTELAEALVAVRARVKAPEIPHGVALDDAAYRDLDDERDAVARTRAAARDERQAFVEDVHADRRAAVPTIAHEVQGLDALRLALLPHLSPARRELVLGLGRQGVTELLGELEHLRLMVRWYAYDREQKMAGSVDWLVDTLGRASTRWLLLQLVLLVIAIMPVFTRRQRIVAWVDRQVHEWSLGSEGGEAARRLWHPVKALATPLLFFGFVTLFFDGLTTLLPSPETELAARIGYVLAIYWLVIAGTHYLLVRIASQPGAPVSAALSARLLHTVRIAGRTAAVIAAFLIIAEAILGRGYLYTLVRQFAWLTALPVVWLTARRWRDDIFDACVDTDPHGSMADMARRYRGRAMGTVIALPMAGWLTARRSTQMVTQGVMQTEQVRRGLSFLFLRRLERQAIAERSVGAEHTLDPELLALIEQRPVDAQLRVERFTRLDDTLADLRSWQSGASGISWAVVGERGAGKTAWLDTLVERFDGSARVLRLDRPMYTAEAFCGWLAESLGLDLDTPTVDVLVDALERGPRRLIVLDDASLTAQRARGRTGGFDALLDMVRRTHNTAWVCTFSRYLWAWLMFARQQQDVFRHVAELDRWSEKEVTTLIERRMVAIGRPVTFDDLMDRPDRRFEYAEELCRTRERYMRLLWDYAEGLPELVLHFWARSLVDPPPESGSGATPPGEATAEGALDPEGRVDADAAGATTTEDRNIAAGDTAGDAPGDADDAAALGPPLRVRLFEVPKPDELEELGDAARFVLHTVVLHTDLDIADAPAVLQQPPDRCLALLEQLIDLGCVNRDGTRYEVPIHWHRAVVRYLRRKHLLAQ